jgi:hypothetical protein
MMELDYEFDEHECAFCKAEVRHGASVCSHCGAYKGVVRQGKDGFFLGIFGGIILAMFGAWGVYGLIGEPYASFPVHLMSDYVVLDVLMYLAFVGGGIGTAYFVIKQGAKPCWLRRN